MGKVIEIIGNTGSGKTTLAQALIQTGWFASGIEQHQERPFQRKMASDYQRYALANQVDYLLLRAEQEKVLRKLPLPGIMDGGLEEDYFLFTHLFKQKGYLDNTEYGICERLYRYLRDSLGAPALVIWLDVPVSVAMERYQSRGRKLEIAQANDLDALEKILRSWMGKAYGLPLVRLDGVEEVDILVANSIEIMREYHILPDQ